MQKFETIQQEITAIDNAQKEAKESKCSLRDFILSDEFLTKYRKFDRLLSVWADTLMSLVGITSAPAGEQPEKKEPVNPLGEGMKTQVESSDITLAKAFVLVIVNLGVIILTIQMRYPLMDENGLIIDYVFGIPWVVPVITAVGSIILCFFQQVVSFVRDLLRKEEKQPQSLDILTNKISENLSYMRNEYVKRRFLIKWQESDSRTVVRHNPKIDSALIDRTAQTLEEMPSDFMGRIDDISVECNNAAFNRKVILYSHLENYQPQTQPQQQPQMMVRQ